MTTGNWEIKSEATPAFGSLEIYIVNNGYLVRPINYSLQMNSGDFITQSYVFQSFEELSGWLKGHLRREDPPA